MELTNEFRVGVPVERAWAVLTDVELIAPCLPGAQLQEIEGDEYRGVVKIKVGPITAQYKGAARFLEQDEAGHKAVLRAEGRETRGQGNANATITAQLTPDSDGTAVSVVTDLTITGRVAQFGRGVLADVSSKLLGQFVDCLETKLLGEAEAAPVAATAGAAAGATEVPGPRDIASEGAAASRQVEEAGAAAAERAAAAAASTPPSDESARLNGTSGPAVRVVHAPEAEPVDLLEAAGAPVARRLAPAVIALTVLWLVSLFVRRRRRRRRAS
ncbi:MAG TPA: SRPBCC family protein [Acidimicrobiales bacterium]|nr:SRPBCC family protein [Acidimicrobiales bacterium]